MQHTLEQEFIDGKHWYDIELVHDMDVANYIDYKLLYLNIIVPLQCIIWLYYYSNISDHLTSTSENKKKNSCDKVWKAKSAAEFANSLNWHKLRYSV
jgi:hypothetical protein